MCDDLLMATFMRSMQDITCLKIQGPLTRVASYSLLTRYQGRYLEEYILGYLEISIGSNDCKRFKLKSNCKGAAEPAEIARQVTSRLYCLCVCVNLSNLLIYCGCAHSFIQLIAENMLAFLVWLRGCSAPFNGLGTFALDN